MSVHSIRGFKQYVSGMLKKVIGKTRAIFGAKPMLFCGIGTDAGIWRGLLSLELVAFAAQSPMS